jgi:hypothetical protein
VQWCSETLGVIINVWSEVVGTPLGVVMTDKLTRVIILQQKALQLIALIKTEMFHRLDVSIMSVLSVVKHDVKLK